MYGILLSTELVFAYLLWLKGRGQYSPFPTPTHISPPHASLLPILILIIFSTCISISVVCTPPIAPPPFFTTVIGCLYHIPGLNYSI